VSDREVALGGTCDNSQRLEMALRMGESAEIVRRDSDEDLKIARA